MNRIHNEFNDLTENAASWKTEQDCKTTTRKEGSMGNLSQGKRERHLKEVEQKIETHQTNNKLQKAEKKSQNIVGSRT